MCKFVKIKSGGMNDVSLLNVDQIVTIAQNGNRVKLHMSNGVFYELDISYPELLKKLTELGKLGVGEF